MPYFEKVLVANRGEVALRIMKTLKKMDIKSVTVYSEADDNAMHVKYADEAIFVGNSPPTESYLSIPNILSAVRVSGAQAVHPGYGFLSENAKFAQQLQQEGVTLIGPSASAILKMGDKISAKKIASLAKVNTVPGYIGTIATEKEAIKIAKKIGFPVIVKAVAGGGGRGMRIINNEQQMLSAFEAAKIEANNSFNDNRVFIEKLIHEQPRHIEIQVLADMHGNTVCLGERECSIQRHHQKVIEEAPSTFIDESIRKKMYKQVISLVKKVGYYSAGTVEFMVDKNKQFYFLEMNTRLQVEHPVTELVTGIDIVEEMIKIAAGKKLSFSQKDIAIQGHAIECRVCAEDPERGFLPSSGRVTEYTPPPTSPSIRLDSCIKAGEEVSMYYDTLVAKLCAFGNTRKDAITKMQQALSSFVISGISHNLSFLEALISHPRFQSGHIHTNFIEEEYPKGFSGANLTSEIFQVFVAATIHIFITEQKRMCLISERLEDQSHNILTRWVVSVDDVLFPVIIKSVYKGYNIRQDSNKITVRGNWQIGSGLFSCEVNGKKVHVKVEKTRVGYILKHAGVTATTYVCSPRVSELSRHIIKHTDKEKEGTIVAPLSGQIVDVKIKAGQKVKKGQDLITSLSMKMENIIKAPHDGTIKKVHVNSKDQMNCGMVLVEYE
ncbi:acetyl-CoA carboxylase biotin carboxylase subunit [Candidatus Sneabacter namystus]|uniref:Acetyl/propionyl/methylcrotonyl-CoA carboxylase subunit alpha n=1 Tax=Candidatus Sneabacter namystus TaxID=2601646 RepID=A0A5C0UJA9_9RICK|nr:acetyl/propionyl/methylcrotonyl-CoA carboxylase subunit alpha [Candidatus Sneabacter namystus]QEK39593.1 acetyl/propionyl/methylcrotonyl-CoA carboxylase subunit alpha [Candidatus Sneabacter namystus]